MPESKDFPVITYRQKSGKEMKSVFWKSTKVQELMSSNLLNSEIAKILGVSRERVRQVRGSNKSPVVVKVSKAKTYAISLIGTMSDAKIAKALGCGEGLVNNLRNKNGVEVFKPELKHGAYRNPRECTCEVCMLAEESRKKYAREYSRKMYYSRNKFATPLPRDPEGRILKKDGTLAKPSSRIYTSKFTK